jgi:hypothetical protein
MTIGSRGERIYETTENLFCNASRNASRNDCETTIGYTMGIVEHRQAAQSTKNDC